MTQPGTSLALPPALPFWVSLTLVPIAWTGAIFGGWTLALLPLYAWFAFSVLDQLLGLNQRNPDVAASTDALFWHRLITLVWPIVQFTTTFTLLAFVTNTDHLSSLEKICLFLGVGLMNGTIGLVYAHELIHRPSRFERFLGDVQLGMVLYGHYRSEHLLVHHRYVATPRDPVTARFREHFWRFYPRVLYQSLVSSFLAEKSLLARKDRPVWDFANPFWRYVTLAAFCLALSFAIGGFSGLALFMTSAGFAIFQLELVNYIEHYGLTRRYLGEGRYEPQQLHHSWNSAHTATSALLINVTRHSDHHASPARPYPLLQSPNEDIAPYLPHGYAIMTTMALVPPLWMRRMNPRVRAWRRRFYPDIADWSEYDKGQNPIPR